MKRKIYRFVSRILLRASYRTARNGWVKPTLYLSRAAAWSWGRAVARREART